MECVQMMLVNLKYKLPFYGEFNLMVNFYDGSDKGVDTCGVNVSRRGMNFYYNNDFLEKLSQKMVNFIVIHENFHLLFNHPKRTVTGRFNPHLANVVQDMIINDIIWKDINHGFVDIPKDEDGKNMGVFLPKEYNDEPIFEILYEWMKDRKTEHDKKKQNGETQENDCESCGGSGQNSNSSESEDGENDEKCEECDGSGQKTDENGNPLDSTGKPAYGDYAQNGVDTWSVDSILDNLDKTKGQYMDSHINDDVPEELKESMVRDSLERLKGRGLVHGGIEDVLNKLRKKRKDYLKEIKRSISNEIFGNTKHKSITKPNRRGIKGLKGHKKLKNKVNVILDVSGSMNGMFEKVLAYVYRNDIDVNLIQCDTQVTSVDTIKNKRKLEQVKIKGLGGTIIQPAIDVVSDRFNKYNNVILTDGMTDTLDFTKIKGKSLIITTHSLCDLSPGTTGVRQIHVDKDN